jgi:hypothetical protein
MPTAVVLALCLPHDILQVVARVGPGSAASTDKATT